MWQNRRRKMYTSPLCTSNEEIKFFFSMIGRCIRRQNYLVKHQNWRVNLLTINKWREKAWQKKERSKRYFFETPYRTDVEKKTIEEKKKEEKTKLRNEKKLSMSRHSQKRLKIKLPTVVRIREKQEEKKKGNYFNGRS